MNNELSELMTVEEVSQFLRIPISTVYKLAKNGEIPALKIGRHWRFHRPLLDKWIIEHIPHDEKDSDFNSG